MEHHRNYLQSTKQWVVTSGNCEKRLAAIKEIVQADKSLLEWLEHNGTDLDALYPVATQTKEQSEKLLAGRPLFLAASSSALTDNIEFIPEQFANDAVSPLGWEPI